MDHDPSPYYLWLRERPDEQPVALTTVPPLSYLLPNSVFTDEDDLTTSA